MLSEEKIQEIKEALKEGGIIASDEFVKHLFEPDFGLFLETIDKLILAEQVKCN